MKGKIKEVLHNVYLIEKEGKQFLATKSYYGSHYGERRFNEFREWIPSRSKLAAILLKGHRIDIQPDWKILYLGAASGTTVSHLADVVEDGIIYAVEYSAKPFTKLIELAEERRNIVPILEDASKPQRYSGIVEKVNFVYQDIAQRNQVEIFLENIGMFLKEGGGGLIMVKARSIDSTANPSDVFADAVERLSKNLKVIAHGDLEPYHRDHIFVHISINTMKLR